VTLCLSLEQPYGAFGTFQLADSACELIKSVIGVVTESKDQTARDVGDYTGGRGQGSGFHALCEQEDRSRQND